MLLSPAHRIRLFPEIGESFELGLDGDYKNNQPLEMVHQAGFTPSGWTHNGPLVTGRAIRLFKLVELKITLPFDEALLELLLQGRIPEGQWIQSFRATFPKTDGKGPIGIADATWVAPDGHPNFPGIGRGGDLRFNRAAGTVGPGRRWIVEAPFRDQSQQ